MKKAALKGHVEIVKLCKKWDETNFKGAMKKTGHVEIVKLCKGCGAND